MKNFVLILVLITINGCAVQQMSGGPSSPSSPSSASGMPSPSTPSTSGAPSSPTSGGISMPSPSLPSGSQSSQSGSQSSSSSSTSGAESSGGNQGSDTSSGNNSDAVGNASPNQSSDSQSGSGAMSSEIGSGQSASSIFDESLGDFDNEIAGERVIIAAANQTLGGMTSQENADAAAVQQGGLDGPLDIESSASDSSIALVILDVDSGLVISSTNLFAFLETFIGSMYSLIPASLAMSARLTSFSSNSLGSAVAASIRDFLSSFGVILLIAFKRATSSAKLSV